MAIRNGPKRTISTSGGFGLLQMVSEPNTRRYASEDARLQGSGLKDLTSVGEETKHSL